MCISFYPQEFLLILVFTIILFHKLCIWCNTFAFQICFCVLLHNFDPVSNRIEWTVIFLSGIADDDNDVDDDDGCA